MEGFLIKIGGPYRIILAEFGLCGLLAVLMSVSTDSWILMAILSFLLGFLVIGTQAGLNALAAHFYPTVIRSTGVGWALGIGRIGSIVGMLLAGMLFAEWLSHQVLLAGAVPAIIAFCSVYLAHWVRSDKTPYAGM